MKVYVATKFENKDEVSRAMESLRAAGHTITHDWTEVDGATYRSESQLAECAIDDLNGVETADALLFIPRPDCRGAWWECGVASANFIPIIIIDNAYARMCIFEHLPGVIHARDLDHAIEILAELAAQYDAARPRA